MAGKRTATTELNHDNWDEEPEEEEAGTFRKAPEEVLKSRVIRTARRRQPTSVEGGTKVFSGFSGFGKPSTGTPSFSFLTKPTTTEPKENGMASLQSNKLIENSPNKATDNLVLNPKSAATMSKYSKYSDEYLGKLKGLNESVSQWIKNHVDKNPFIILTPVFKDYEKYISELEEIKSNRSDDSSNVQSSGFTTSSANTFAKESFASSQIYAESLGKSSTQSADVRSFGTSIFNPFLANPIPINAGQSSQISAIPPTFNTGLSVSANQSATSTIPSFSLNRSKGHSLNTINSIPSPTNEMNEIASTEESEEPPKNDFKPVVEEKSLYSKRCKVFVKSSGDFKDRGVGQLYIKSVDGSEKVQVIVRADTSLGNLLLNILLTNGIPLQRMGKNNVMLVCLPTPESKPPPTPVLLRVKTAEEADELLETLNRYKK